MKMTVQYTAYATKRETKQRIDFEIDFRLVWMMFTFFRVMLSKSEDFTCICSIAQFPDWMYLYIFFLWSFDHRHFNFIHSGMIFTLLFSSWWEWSGIRFGLQTALYICSAAYRAMSLIHTSPNYWQINSTKTKTVQSY